MKRCAFQTIRPVVSRKNRAFSAHFGPGGAVLPPRVSPFSNVKRSIVTACAALREILLKTPQKRRKKYKRRAWWRTMSDAFHGAGDRSLDVTSPRRKPPRAWQCFNGAGDCSPDMTRLSCLFPLPRRLQWGRGLLPGYDAGKVWLRGSPSNASMGPGIAPRI